MLPTDRDAASSSTKPCSSPAAYLDATLELDDPVALLVALRHVARIHGMADLARRAELGDKTLFRALAPNGNPTLSTMHRVLREMGLRLSVVPIS